jgi:hypothetical protein
MKLNNYTKGLIYYPAILLLVISCQRVKYSLNPDSKTLPKDAQTTSAASTTTPSNTSPNNTQSSTNTTTNNTTTNNTTTTNTSSTLGSTTPPSSSTSTTTSNTQTGTTTIPSTNTTTSTSTTDVNNQTASTSTTGNNSTASNSTNTTTNTTGGTSSTSSTSTTSGTTSNTLASGIAAVMQPQVDSVNIKNGQLTISGTNLDSVTLVTFAGFNFEILSKAAGEVIASALSSMDLSSSIAYSLIVSNAYGASTTPITISIDGITSFRDAATGLVKVGIGTISPSTALEVKGVITADNLNQKPFFSKKNGATRFTAPAGGGWRATGESIDIVVPANQKRKFRLSFRQLVYNSSFSTAAAYAFVSLSTSPTLVNNQIEGVPKGMGSVLEYLPLGSNDGWHTVSSEGYVELDGGTGGKTFTYYVLSGGWGGEVQYANSIADDLTYCSVIAWPL